MTLRHLNGGEEFVIVNTHPNCGPETDDDGRVLQNREMLNTLTRDVDTVKMTSSPAPKEVTPLLGRDLELGGFPASNAIVCGDFNASPHSESIRIMSGEGSFRDCFAESNPSEKV
jgi:endonuclease/exonuclease/phosphatase family metal-dependent hydrolase